MLRIGRCTGIGEPVYYYDFYRDYVTGKLMIVGNQSGSEAMSFNGGIAATSFLASGTGGVGYSTGAGGTSTQATSKATAPTALNKPSGTITMHNANLVAGTIVQFTMSNSCCAIGDTMEINHISGGTLGAYTFNAVCGAGDVTIYVRNATAGDLAEALVLKFNLTKGVNA